LRSLIQASGRTRRAASVGQPHYFRARSMCPTEMLDRADLQGEVAMGRAVRGTMLLVVEGLHDRGSPRVGQRVGPLSHWVSDPFLSLSPLPLWVRDGRSSPRGKGRLGRGEFALNCIRLCLWSGGIAFVVQRCSSFVAFSYAMQISGRHTWA
jgi:hypothetical protein